MSLLITIGLTHLLALISPGPDFILITKNSIYKSRRDGFFTALGFSLGVLIHLSFGLLGFSLIISQVPWLLKIIQYIGAGYLSYLGYKTFWAPPFSSQQQALLLRSNDKESFLEGLFTNLLNVKAMLFFMTLILTILTPDTSIFIQLASITIMVLMTFLWFSLLTHFLSLPHFQTLFLRLQRVIERTLAIFLWILAFKLSGVSLQ